MFTFSQQKNPGVRRTLKALYDKERHQKLTNISMNIMNSSKRQENNPDLTI
jgi:hypothetical protein